MEMWIIYRGVSSEEAFHRRWVIRSWRVQLKLSIHCTHMDFHDYKHEDVEDSPGRCCVESVARHSALPHETHYHDSHN